jgi:predicted cupin superfamily sugar epimerase
MVKLEVEGGYYHESYRSDKYVHVGGWCDSNPGNNVYSCPRPGHGPSDVRPVLTLIYYLLDGDQFSAFHKVRYDEIWHFYKGSSVNLYILTHSKKLLNIKLGNDIKNDEQVQFVIRGNTWFGADLNDKSSYSLIGCSVSPGFDFRDFELGERDRLKTMYPQHEHIINRLTRK